MIPVACRLNKRTVSRTEPLRAVFLRTQGLLPSLCLTHKVIASTSTVTNVIWYTRIRTLRTGNDTCFNLRIIINKWN